MFQRFFVSFQYRHHGKYSAYTQIVRYFPDATVLPGAWCCRGGTNSRTLFNRVMNRLVDPHGVLASSITELHMYGIGRKIFHFIRPENQWKPMYAHRASGVRLVATYHQPHDALTEMFEAEGVDPRGQWDGIIALSRREVNGYREVFGTQRVVFIPLGVDTDFFCPDDRVAKEHKVLMVGNWLRDASLAAGIIDILQRTMPDLKLEVIGLRTGRSLLEGRRNVFLRNEISDADLLKAYRSALLVLLPLKQAVANNALLESMACGTPTVVSGVGGVPDYAAPMGTIVVEPNEVRCFVDAIQSLLRSPRRLRDMGQACRKHAMLYTWQRVAKSVGEFHATIMDKR